MISDDFETFIDDNFWRWHTKTKILVKKIIHFIKIQNIHSIKIFIFLKSRIFIQQNFHFFRIQNIHSKKVFIFFKSRLFIQKNIHFFKRGRRPYRPGLSDCKNMHNDHKCQHECGNANVARTWQQCRYNGSRLSMWPCLARLAAAKNTFWCPLSGSESIVCCEGTFWGRNGMQVEIMLIRRKMVCWVSWQKHRSCWSHSLLRFFWDHSALASPLYAPARPWDRPD